MNHELYEKSSIWVDEHRDALVADIKRLLCIPSIPTDDGVAPFGQPCHDVLDEFLAIATEHGFETANYDYQVACVWLPEQAGEVEKSIGLWGHLDVVPAGDNWTYPPFDPVEENGFLIARGAQDNKGPAVAAMYVARCLRDLGVELRHPLRIYGGTNEERGMEDLAYFTAHYPCPALSIIPDSGFPVCYAEKGSLTGNLVSDFSACEDVLAFCGGEASNMVPDNAEITLRASKHVLERLEYLPKRLQVTREADRITIHARGISKHTAFPEGGENAIAELCLGLAAAEILDEEGNRAMLALSMVNLGFAGRGLGIMCQDDISGPLTCVGSMCSLEEQRRFVLHFNIRYPVEADADTLLQHIGNTCAAHDFHMDQFRDSKPNHFPKDHPLVSALTGVFQEITGSDEEAFSMGGGTYARKLPNAFAYGMGLPSIADRSLFRPGHGGAHGPDEALDIEGLLQAMKIYCAALPVADTFDF